MRNLLKRLFPRHPYAKGGYIGTPMVGTPIEVPLVQPGELVIHKDGTLLIVNNDRTCSEVHVDRAVHTRVAEYLHDMDHGETITEHEDTCQLEDCQTRTLYLEDAKRIINVITTGEPQ